MAGSSPTPDRPASPPVTRASRVALLAGVLGLGAIGLVLASDLPGPLRSGVSQGALILGGLVLAAACWHRRAHSIGRRRRAWLLFGCAALAAAAAHVVISAGDLVGEPQLRSVGDLLLVGGLATAVVGLTLHPAAPERAADLTRVLLDSAVLAGSILLILALLTVLPRPDDATVLSEIGVLAAPVIDIVLVTVCWVLFLRSMQRDRSPLALAGVGFTLFAVSDIIASVQRSAGTFTYGSVSDLGWIAGYAVLALAVARSPAPPEPVPAGVRDTSRVAKTLIIFTVFGLAGTLTLNEAAKQSVSIISALLLGAVMVAIIARQVLLLVDNDRLRASLEARVQQRTTELADVTQRTGLLVNSVQDGVYGVDGEGRVTFLNPAGARLLGVQPDALLTRSAHQAFHSHPVADCYLRTISRTGLAITGMEDSYRTADGRLVWVEVTASPMVEGTGVRGVVVVFRDVTRRREVDRMKSEFVSLVSHELKTPLTAIRGSLGLLAGGALGELAPPATRMVEIAMESSERLTRLINEILDMERIESGAIPMEIGVHEVADLLSAAQDQVQVLAAEAGVRVEVEQSASRVLADSDRVVQTLINLIGNAIKFSPPGSVVALEVGSAEEGELRFRVTDRGRGIPPGRLEAIFERFEQVDSSDAREKGGSGLGLAISRSIVERLGGRIWAENNDPGPGATFTFTLPAAVPPPVQEVLVAPDRRL